jgi:16S rRNA (adenine1518-N6/adenine1519-N6)-dimethyltransferase
MKAKKHFSQNFLQDDEIIQRIVQVMAVQKNDRLLEVGPGKGALTHKLSLQCEQLIALEIDQQLVTFLTQQFATIKHVHIEHQDALSFAYNQQKPFRLVSNLPYHLSTALIRRFISARENIVDMHLMMQKEVADRLLCCYGKSRGWLSVIIELLCDAEHLFDVPAESFYPVPKVKSSVIRLAWKKDQNFSVAWLASFEKMLMQAFGHKRKTLLNNFSHSSWTLKKEDWQKMNIDYSQRAEQLSLEDYLILHNNLVSTHP